MRQVPQYEEQIRTRLQRRQPRSNMSIAAAVWNLGAATVYSTSSTLLEFVQMYEQMLRSMTQQAERQAIRSADEIVADSEWTGARQRAQILDQADRVYVDLSTVEVKQAQDRFHGDTSTTEYTSATTEFAESGSTA